MAGEQARFNLPVKAQVVFQLDGEGVLHEVLGVPVEGVSAHHIRRPQLQTINSCCGAIHNFIRESALADVDFEMADHDECYMAPSDASSSQNNADTSQHGDEDQDMNQFRDWIADGLSNRS
ncbi:uncharacterized protein C2845_PM07G28780 [Panicum miliaceum]|uniref:Uncharacterized protein n=1 Tax=Panicum miliaceum TaxID=4540 RepID=A0A3L6SJZ6_PANMI|nr:uncharacterized protein C2845_PM07G28780 [Panicum miliaceum]